MIYPRYQLTLQVCLDDTSGLGPDALKASAREAALLLPARVGDNDIGVELREIEPLAEDEQP